MQGLYSAGLQFGELQVLCKLYLHRGHIVHRLDALRRRHNVFAEQHGGRDDELGVLELRSLCCGHGAEGGVPHGRRQYQQQMVRLRHGVRRVQQRDALGLHCDPVLPQLLRGQRQRVRGPHDLHGRFDVRVRGAVDTDGPHVRGLLDVQYGDGDHQARVQRERQHGVPGLPGQLDAYVHVGPVLRRLRRHEHRQQLHAVHALQRHPVPGLGLHRHRRPQLRGVRHLPRRTVHVDGVHGPDRRRRDGVHGVHQQARRRDAPGPRRQIPAHRVEHRDHARRVQRRLGVHHQLGRRPHCRHRHGLHLGVRRGLLQNVGCQRHVLRGVPRRDLVAAGQHQRRPVHQQHPQRRECPPRGL
mmetsp:Transcript_14219/g.29481  ORF Transcript_14219/g.29481 Transcript_14219/m.29481 type:complete len:355 (+) Transcript_14219:737-1801(+)